MRDIENAFFVLEKCRDLGQLRGSMLARLPGWDRVKASRYLRKLAELGWLEAVNSGKRSTIYVLGRKTLALAPEFRM